jgi:hypothetical protein
MNFTSMGYHTFSLFRKLTVSEGAALLDAFKKYGKRTGIIRVRPLWMDDTDHYSDEFLEKIKSRSQYHIVEYTAGNVGLRWLLRLSSSSPGFISHSLGRGDVDRPCSIKATINPKLFTGERDYLTAANTNHLPDVETRFNLEAAKISPILGRFADYEFNRIDYCINFALRELGIDCDPLLIMELLQRSNLPKHFYRKYVYGEDLPLNGKAAGIASLPAGDPDRNKFILTSNSININCYYKYDQLRENFPDCPDIRASGDIIRFEIQCLYPKAYYMSKALKGRDGFTDLFSEMLSDDTSAGIVCNYFDKIIMQGDYYSMDEAVKKIQASHFTSKVGNRLIAVLKEIEVRGGIANAKIGITKPEAREDFRRSLRDLAKLRINPVVIPDRYGIDHIPNLLDAYCRKVAEERQAKFETEAELQMLEGFMGKRTIDFLRKQRLG